VFLEAARRLGVSPDACLVYEDAELGIEAARRAGMRHVDVRLLGIGPNRESTPHGSG
jgi:beta-phosphoglucomutase-like phosphatase (HAD superfamily)